jgi:addiction module HigA family antidote
MLLHEFLEPLGMEQVELAKRIGVTFQRVNAIVRGRRGITPDTALRLGKLFNTGPEVWLNLQLRWELYHAMHSKEAATLEDIKPIRATA